MVFCYQTPLGITNVDPPSKDGIIGGEIDQFIVKSASLSILKFVGINVNVVAVVILKVDFWGD